MQEATYNSVILDKNGNREPRIGEVFISSQGVPGRDLLLNGASYLRSAYPKVEKYYQSPISTAGFVNGTWAGAAQEPSLLEANPSTNTIILATTSQASGSLKRSTNHGSSWATVNYPGGLNTTGYIIDLAVNGNTWVGINNYKASPNTAYAAIVRSTDDGATWSASSMPSGLNPMSITYGNGVWVITGLNSSNVPVATRSTDGGATWSTLISLPTTIDTYSVNTWTTWMYYRTLAYGDGKFFWLAAGNNSGYGTYKPHIFYSTDGGVTWSAKVLGGGSANNTYSWTRAKYIEIINDDGTKDKLFFLVNNYGGYLYWIKSDLTNINSSWGFGGFAQGSVTDANDIAYINRTLFVFRWNYSTNATGVSYVVPILDQSTGSLGTFDSYTSNAARLGTVSNSHIMIINSSNAPQTEDISVYTSRFKLPTLNLGQSRGPQNQNIIATYFVRAA